MRKDRGAPPAWTFAVVLASFIWSAIPTLCLAQASPRVAILAHSPDGFHLRGQGVHVSDILCAVGQELGLTIVADLPPLSDRIDISADGTEEDILNAICDKLDLVRSKRGRALLVRHSFAAMGTGPQLNLGEVSETAKDMCRVLDSVLIDGDAANVPVGLNTLAHSLTAEQVSRLRAGDRIQIATLAPDQIGVLKRTALAVYLGVTATTWRELHAELDRMQGSHFEVREYPAFYNRRAGVSPEIPPNTAPDWQLTWVDQYAPFREYLLTVSVPPPNVELPATAATENSGGADAASTASHPRLVPLSPSDATTATLPPRELRPITRLVGNTTVSRLADILAAESSVRIDVQGAIADRSVFAYIHDASSADVLEALAELDGWTCERRGNGSIAVSRRRVDLPKSPSEIPVALRACIPPEVLQFLGAGTPVNRAVKLREPDIQRAAQMAKTRPDYDRFVTVLAGQRMVTRLSDDYKASLRRLPLAQLYAGKHVRFDSAGKMQQSAVVALLALRAITRFNDLGANSYLTGQLTALQRDVRNGYIRANARGGLEVEAESSTSGEVMKTGFGGELEPGLMELLKHNP